MFEAEGLEALRPGQEIRVKDVVEITMRLALVVIGSFVRSV